MSAPIKPQQNAKETERLHSISLVCLQAESRDCSLWNTVNRLVLPRDASCQQTGHAVCYLLPLLLLFWKQVLRQIWECVRSDGLFWRAVRTFAFKDESVHFAVYSHMTHPRSGSALINFYRKKQTNWRIWVYVARIFKNGNWMNGSEVITPTGLRSIVFHRAHVKYCGLFCCTRAAHNIPGLA